jgi:hypothetical protein
MAGSMAARSALQPQLRPTTAMLFSSSDLWMRIWRSGVLYLNTHRIGVLKEKVWVAFKPG